MKRYALTIVLVTILFSVGMLMTPIAKIGSDSRRSIQFAKYISQDKGKDKDKDKDKDRDRDKDRNREPDSREPDPIGGRRPPA